MKKKLYFIVGPTASGKTALSVEVAIRLNAEIVSADSIQIYKGLDIGSAKPGEDEKRGVVHHMMDCVDPCERDYSVVRYREDALACIEAIHSRGRDAIVVGGTGLYVNSLIYPLNFPSTPPNEALREYWKAREAENPGCAHAQLKHIDPETAARLHPNDVKRVVRAIEIHEGTGQKASELAADFTKRDDTSLGHSPVMAGLTMPRELLYERIEKRVNGMLALGLEEEVRGLIRAGVPDTVPSMQGLGYKQLYAYIKGRCSRDDAIDDIKRETRRYAKRQLTWFRREERIRWFDISAFNNTDAAADEVCSYFTEV